MGFELSTSTGKETKLSFLTRNATDDGTASFGTVPIGKVWRIYAAWVTISVVNSLSGGDTRIKGQILINGSSICTAHCPASDIKETACNSTSINFGGYIELVTGTDVWLYIINGEPASCSCEAAIFYTEVAV